MNKTLPIVLVFVLLITFLNDPGHGQTITITGTVSDSLTRKGIQGVTLYNSVLQIGTVTDGNGNYTLSVPTGGNFSTAFILQHIGYERKFLTLLQLFRNPNITLEPKDISLNEIKVEGKAFRPENQGELPQSVTVINIEKFENKGFMDVADVLKMDHSVQVAENFSGKKMVSMRGGNSDEVIIMMNGVKLNTALNNQFDLASINLDQVDRFEIIKGSNTSLYGPDAFSGVVNIVPKMDAPYLMKFTQKVGTYNLGEWNLNAFHKMNSWSGNAAIKKSAYERGFSGAPALMKNNSEFLNANLNYQMSNDLQTMNPHVFTFSGISSKQTFNNQRDKENLQDELQFLSGSYSGSIFLPEDFKFQLSLKNNLINQNFITSGTLIERTTDEQQWVATIQENFVMGDIEITGNYQFSHSNILQNDLKKIGAFPIQFSPDMSRIHHGFATVVKIKGPENEGLLQTMDVNGSFRYDYMTDDITTTITGQAQPTSQQTVWQKGMAKFAVFLSGSKNDYSYSGFASAGTNFKFPTLAQQFSSPVYLLNPYVKPNLDVEKNQSVEIGFSVTKQSPTHPYFSGWKLDVNLMNNAYDNKFRMFYSPGSTVTLFDNVPLASIAGIESIFQVYIFNYGLTFESGISKYFISEKSAFPFKSDQKLTGSIIYDYDGWTAILHGFYESDQLGWIRLNSGGFKEITLSNNRNMDIHIGKKIQAFDMTLAINGSIRNLISDEESIQGLAIRDRRIYLSVSFQY